MPGGQTGRSLTAYDGQDIRGNHMNLWVGATLYDDSNSSQSPSNSKRRASSPRSAMRLYLPHISKFNDGLVLSGRAMPVRRGVGPCV